MVRIEYLIYCLKCGGVHERTEDPFQYGTNDPDDLCPSAEWRPIYWRPRKGDDPS